MVKEKFINSFGIEMDREVPKKQKENIIISAEDFETIEDGLEFCLREIKKLQRIEKERKEKDVGEKKEKDDGGANSL